MERDMCMLGRVSFKNDVKKHHMEEHEAVCTYGFNTEKTLRMYANNAILFSMCKFFLN